MAFWKFKGLFLGSILLCLSMGIFWMIMARKEISQRSFDEKIGVKAAQFQKYSKPDQKMPISQEEFPNQGIRLTEDLESISHTESLDMREKEELIRSVEELLEEKELLENKI